MIFLMKEHGEYFIIGSIILLSFGLCLTISEQREGLNNTYHYLTVAAVAIFFIIKVLNQT